MKMIGFILVFVSMVGISSAQADMNDLRKMNKQEIILEINNIITQIEMLERFENIFQQDDSIVYEKDELTGNVKPTKQNGIQAFQEFKEATLSLVQQFKNGKIEYKIDDGFFIGDMNAIDFEILITPKIFYFFDGTSINAPMDNKAIDYHFYEKTSFAKRIDSIQFELSLKSTTQFDTLSIDKNNPGASYKNQFIKLIALNKNQVSYLYSKDLSPTIVEALNAKGEAIANKSHASFDVNYSSFSVFSQLKDRLEAIVTKIEADSSMSNENFQQNFLPMIEKEFAWLEGGDTMKYEGKFKGDVQRLKFWFAQVSHTHTEMLTVRSLQFPNIHLSFNDEDPSTHFLNNEGQSIYVHPSILYQINDQYYQDNDDKYYFFNAASKSMQPLSYHHIKPLKGDYVSVSEIEKKPNNTLYLKGKRLGDFEYITAEENTILCIADSEKLFIDVTNKTHSLNQYEYVDEIHKRYLRIIQNGKYGFINQNGQITIPTIYDDAHRFSDATTPRDILFAVEKSGKWGFVDLKNNLVIPFEYEEVIPFSYGISMVIKDGNRGLINTSNKQLTQFTSNNGYSLSTNFGKRTYRFGGKTYNHLGEEVTSDEK